MVPEEATVISCEKRLADLLEDPGHSWSRDSNQPPIPKIQRVQHYLRPSTDFGKYYSPQLLSIGPIHHLDQNLKQGEEHKNRWTRAFLTDAKALEVSNTAVQILGQKAQSIAEAAAQQPHQNSTEADVQQLLQNITEEAAQQLQVAVHQFRFQNITESAVLKLRQNIREVAAQQLQVVVRELQFKIITEVVSQQLRQAIIEVVAQQLRQDIVTKIEDLKKLYSEDAIKEYEDQDLIWMLFVDGCSILHILENAGNWDVNTAKKLEIGIHQLAILLQDMLLFENQLPCEVLKLLAGENYQLQDYMLKLLQNHNMVRKLNENQTKVMIFQPVTEPAHLLDLLRTILLDQPPSFFKSSLLLEMTCKCMKWARETFETQSHYHQNIYKNRTIQELKSAGIRLKRSEKASLEYVKFTSYGFGATLELPEIIVDDLTAFTFANLIAYEMSPSFANDFEISSYVAFLDLLIGHSDDVKDLRSAGVLRIHMGNDEEVVKLFKTISTDFIYDMTRYAVVRNQIERHCSVKWNTLAGKWMGWMDQVYRDHCSSPWAIIGLVSGVLVIGLTMIQTWFTVWPARRGDT